MTIHRMLKDGRLKPAPGGKVWCSTEDQLDPLKAMDTWLKAQDRLDIARHAMARRKLALRIAEKDARSAYSRSEAQREQDIQKPKID